MDIETWFETMPSQVVNSVALSKRYIRFELHHPKALTFDHQTTIIREVLDMTRKVKDARQTTTPVTTPVKKPQSSSSPTKWVSCDIRSREHKAAIRELAANASFVLDTLVELCDDGYEFIIKRTDKSATVRAMAFCKVPGHANENYAMSAEAPDAWLAITAFVYKHVHMLDGKWTPDEGEDEEDDGWR